MNVYYAQKSNFLKLLDVFLRENNLIKRPKTFSFTPYIIGLDNNTISISAGFLHAPFFNAQSIVEKYAIVGWFISRQLMYEIAMYNDRNLLKNGQVLFESICNSSVLTSFEVQLCCLSRRYSSMIFEKDDLETLSADINGLMLSFETYKTTYMRKLEDLIDEKSFFATFAKMMNKDLSSYLVHAVSNSSKPSFVFSLTDVLQHSQEFSDAYQCAVTTKMNHVNKCTL
ncbi:unnamed protein product [Schistosoma turkestanicum]|nr:unnamed protein product [Schistosoma turkestanicum]